MPPGSPGRLRGLSKGPVPGGAFVQCAHCKKIIFSADFTAGLSVCPHCNHHHRLTAPARIECLFDEGSFHELDADLSSVDDLTFPEYAQKLGSAVEKSKRQDGMMSGTATLEGRLVAAAIADFSFMGGSMGAVNGEKVTRTLERAADARMPAIVVCASGGARMQEGLQSLMQMAKTTAAVARCREAGAPFLCVFSDPTMAGVLASYASVADVILAEPKALVGFAGLRVSKQAGVGKVPDDFQTAEYALKHGMIDRIVPRKELRPTLARLCRLLAPVGPS